MAVGGVPDIADLRLFEENIQEQNDEVLVLQSIFEADEDRLQILSTANGGDAAEENQYLGNMLKIFIPVKVPDGGKLHMDVYQPLNDGEFQQSKHQPPGLALARSESGQRIIWSFDVTYLPPLCLHVTLPETYPSRDSPSFVISCLWLSPKQLTLLCQELDRLWSENKSDGSPGMPILYTWVDWLQENLLRCLGIDCQISLTSHVLDEDVDDCRVVMETNDLEEIVTNVMRYNRDQEFMEFYKTDQECGICFDTLPGSKFFLLTECKHHVCKECMKEQCQILVKDGTVQNLRCPAYKCTSSIPPLVLKEVLTEEQFARYESLALQNALDVMHDVTYCPRCNSVVIGEPEQNLNLAHCLACFYSFCVDCQGKWHPGDDCKLLTEEQEKQLKEKIEEKLKYEKDGLRKARQEIEIQKSYSYINKMASKCPTCSSRIMKMSGCNKVVCTVCSSAMCWVCKARIESYAHFSDSPSCNTFSMDQEMIDNTDIGNRDDYGVLYAARPIRPPPAPPTQGRLLEERIKADPTLIDKVLRCMSCRQKNLKESNSNHIHCWNCKTSLCFHCRQKIMGPVGKHYAGLASCPQHSL